MHKFISGSLVRASDKFVHHQYLDEDGEEESEKEDEEVGDGRTEGSVDQVKNSLPCNGIL